MPFQETFEKKSNIAGVEQDEGLKTEGGEQAKSTFNKVNKSNHSLI